MTNLFVSSFVIFIYYSLYCCASVEVLRPRGVSLSSKIFYVPGKDFNCIDGSDTIPFSFVNDDYCDCDDGSDEPGTAACSNTFFHCINAGFETLNIPSSRVNDNICDCCDGGDEYNSTSNCINICFELGKQAREEKEKQRELFEIGFGLWRQYSALGKEIKEKNKLQLENLKKIEFDEEELKAVKRAIRDKAEDKEKAVLDVYKLIKEEQQKKQEEIEMLQHQEDEKKNAEIAFFELDSNHDNVLTYEEIQQISKFDSDHDGQVSEEEAKFFLHMKDSMELDEFVTTGWMIMKPIYFIDKEPVIDSPMHDEIEKEQSEIPQINNEETDDEPYNPEDDSPLDDDLLDDDDPLKPPVFASKEEPDSSKHEDPQYDDETKKIVDEADAARKELQVVDDRYEKVQEDIKQLQSFIESDFGHAEEFAVLKGQCFDYEDREYTYRFCPFDKASQIAKSGGSDVNLGRWGSWAGPEINKYSKMKFDNGLLCWNGPSRSVMVLVQCGTENKLLSSSEPNRCEYLFEFSTPAMCSSHEAVKSGYRHEEL